jgi:hypothetical protein
MHSSIFLNSFVLPQVWVDASFAEEKDTSGRKAQKQTSLKNNKQPSVLSTHLIYLRERESVCVCVCSWRNLDEYKSFLSILKAQERKDLYSSLHPQFYALRNLNDFEQCNFFSQICEVGLYARWVLNHPSTRVVSSPTRAYTS